VAGRGLYSVNIHEIFTVLRQTQALRKLSLEHAVHPGELYDAPTAVVSLPSLQHLHVQDCRQVVILLLARIQTPEHTFLDIGTDFVTELMENDDEHDETLAFLRDVRNCITSLHRQPGPRAIFSRHTDNRYELITDYVTGTRSISSSSNLKLVYDNTYLVCAEAFLHTQAYFLKDLIDLVIDDGTNCLRPDDSSSFHSALTGMPSLLYLSLHKSTFYVRPLFTALSNPNSGQSVVCPALTTLRILYCNVWGTGSLDRFDFVYHHLRLRWMNSKMKFGKLEIDEIASVNNPSDKIVAKRKKDLSIVAENVLIP
jgi:hypothetical protein